jgi:hypothetical protein
VSDPALAISIVAVVLGAAAIAIALLIYFVPRWQEARFESSGDVLVVRLEKKIDPVLPTIPAGPGMLFFTLRNRVGHTVPIQIAVNDAIPFVTSVGGFGGEYKSITDVFDRIPVNVRPNSSDPYRFDLGPRDRAEIEVRLFPKPDPHFEGTFKVAIEVSVFATGFKTGPYDLGPYFFQISYPVQPGVPDE